MAELADASDLVSVTTVKFFCGCRAGYDNRPKTVSEMYTFLAENGFANDFTDNRLHHEIYISNPNKCAEEKQKTIIRHPIIAI